MTGPKTILLVASLLGALAMWLLLPRGDVRGRMAGAVFGAVSLGLFASQIAWVQDWVSNGLFAILATVTVISAAAAMTCRNPVYCAIWFGATLLGTAGLFLLQGAQFLAVATVAVYAGAILVTFLFVLMLAQASGQARYDRVSWEALVSASCGACLSGVLTVAVVAAFRAPEVLPPVEITAEQRRQAVLAPEHMVQIGGELFGRYVVAVEVGGTLLLAALVGAAVIVGQTRGPLAGPAAAHPVDDRLAAPAGVGGDGDA